MPEEPKPPTPPAGGAHVEPWLDAFRTGELAEADRVRVERHLARCAECAAQLAEIESLARTATRAFAAGAGLASRAEPDWGRLQAAILARTVGPAPARRPRPSLLRFAPQAALAALAVLVLVILAREGVRGPADLERALKKSDDSARANAPAVPGGPEGKPGPAEALSGALSRERSDLRDKGEQVAQNRQQPESQPSIPEGQRLIPAPLPTDEPEGQLESRTEGFRPYGAEEKAARKEAAPEAEARPSTARAQGEKAGDRMAKTAQTGAPAAADEADFAGNEAPQPADAVGRDADLAAAAPPLALMDALQRIDLYARKALASGNAEDRARALDFWRDSVAIRADLDPTRKRAAAALVDSLARSAPAQP
jgi:hypothetical protein